MQIEELETPQSFYEKASFLAWISKTKIRYLIKEYEGEETLDMLPDDYYDADTLMLLLEGAFRARVNRKESGVSYNIEEKDFCRLNNLKNICSFVTIGKPYHSKGVISDDLLDLRSRLASDNLDSEELWELIDTSEKYLKLVVRSCSTGELKTTNYFYTVQPKEDFYRQRPYLNTKEFLDDLVFHSKYYSNKLVDLPEDQSFLQLDESGKTFQLVDTSDNSVTLSSQEGTVRDYNMSELANDFIFLDGAACMKEVTY